MISVVDPKTGVHRTVEAKRVIFIFMFLQFLTRKCLT